VNQVRRYRNWAAHGRRGDEPESIDPPAAYFRLSTFLARFFPAPILDQPYIDLLRDWGD